MGAVYRLGMAFILLAFVFGLFNPFLENVFWRRVSIGLLASGVIFAAVGWDS